MGPFWPHLFDQAFKEGNTIMQRQVQLKNMHLVFETIGMVVDWKNLPALPLHGC
jgi:hypothetical protein